MAELKTTNSFGPGVKIGNWNEDLFLQEETLEKIKELNQTGTAPFLVTQTAIETAKEKTSTSASDEKTISFGDQVMVVHFAGSALCSVPSQHAASDDGMMLGGSDTDTTPMKRNTFTVKSYENEKPDGEAICYEDKFILEMAHPSSDKKINMYSERPGLSSPMSRYSGEQRVVLSETSDGEAIVFGSAWKCIAADPEYRLELEGEPIPLRQPVVLVHAQTGQALCCNYQLRQKLRTEFGVDHEVTCCTKMSRAKIEQPENHWLFTT
eukprot:m.79781 g.79781  ORF g.79781 m.79781 type:complete len:266 (-) comp12728_c0_seq4:190-987(-)